VGRYLVPPQGVQHVGRVRRADELAVVTKVWPVVTASSRVTMWLELAEGSGGTTLPGYIRMLGGPGSPG
jgi:hypothetical protein